MAADRREAIASYVSDMLALEEHIEKALAGQVSDLRDQDPAFATELEQMRRTCEQHSATLKGLSERREQAGQGIAKAVKKAASSVLGAGAAAIDFVRTEKLPKNIRDDYAALSLACIGYVMLHTTALSLEDREVAEIAQYHLRDHAKCVMTLHNLAPAAVMKFLQEDGHQVDMSVAGEIQENIESVWRSESGVPQVDEMVQQSTRSRGSRSA